MRQFAAHSLRESASILVHIQMSAHKNKREHFLLILGLGVAQLANSQSATGLVSLSGTVSDPQGRGIGAALVSLAKGGSSNLTESTTDATGHFKFDSLQPGAYKIVASANGFQSQTRAVDAAREANPELIFTLDLAPVQSTITVHGEQEGIVVPTSSAGSLTPISIMDIPQSVQVVNRELLDEQKTFQYADAITYLSGVQRAYTAIAGGLGNEVAMRGFNLDFNNNYLRDGFKFYGLAISDTADIEEVDVLKGPASALYGTAEAGGILAGCGKSIVC